MKAQIKEPATERGIVKPDGRSGEAMAEADRPVRTVQPTTDNRVRAA
jgi:hypothetical protein